MTAFNQKYSNVLSKFNGLSRWIDDPFKIFLSWHINGIFAPRYYEKIDAVFKEKLPKVKKVNRAYIEETYPEIAEEIKADIQKQIDRYLVIKVRQHKILNKWLSNNAAKVELAGAKQIVYASNTSTFSSQTSPLTYTRSSCLAQAAAIKAVGIDCEVLPLYCNKGYQSFADDRNGNIYTKDGAALDGSEAQRECFGHAVIAKLEPFMLDAIARKQSQTELEWAVSCWKNGANPKVLNPFLSDKVFDESLEISRNS